MSSIKLFISHASEDKEDFVEPLARLLKEEGFDVWYDKWMLTMGDSLLKKIGEGLSQCDFGIVVLSENFFRKDWPSEELDGLFALQTETRKVILPIWKNVTKAEVCAYSPILAGKLAALASNGIPSVVDEIRRAVDTTFTVKKFSSVENSRSKFQLLDKKVSGGKKALGLSRSEEGVRMACDAIDSIIGELKKNLEEIGSTSESMKFKIDPEGRFGITVWCPYRLRLWVKYHLKYGNDLSESGLMIYVAHSKFGVIDTSSERDVLKKYILSPIIDHTMKLLWKDSAKAFTTEQVTSFILDELEQEISKLHDKALVNKQL